MPELYAATPPLECLRVMVSDVMAGGRKVERTSMLVCDVSRAFFCAPSVGFVHVTVVDEDLGEGDGTKCGKLNVPMYGARDAALNWHEHHKGHLVGHGFKHGKASPRVFCH